MHDRSMNRRHSFLLFVVLVSILISSCGHSDSIVTVPVLPPPQAKFVYTVNGSSRDIYGYSVDTTTGALSLLSGFPMSTPVNPSWIVTEPSNKFVLVANTSGDARIHVYAVNASTGSLQEAQGSPYSAGIQPQFLAMHSAGKFVYAADFQMPGKIYGFQFNSTTGALTPVPGSPFTAGSLPMCMTFGQLGRFLYVASYLTDQVLVYTVDQATGALTQVSATTTPRAPGYIAVDTMGAYAYVSDFGTKSITSYSIDHTTGALTQSAQLVLTGNAGAYTITLDNTDRFLYATTSAGIAGYSISNGTLTPVPGSPFPAVAAIRNIVIDPSNTFLYVPQDIGMNSVAAFKIDPISGALTTVPGSPFATGNMPQSIAIVSK